MKAPFFVSMLAVAAAAQDAGRVFEDEFSHDTIARRPSYTVVGRRLAEDRGVQNPAIIEGRDGVLIAAWSNKKVGLGGRWMDNHPSNTMQSSYSTDGGRTWSAQTAASGAGSINAAFLRDARTGDLLLLYNANRSEIQDDTRIAYRRSADNGRSWGAPIELDTGFPIDVMVHSGIVLSNGEWLVPFHYDRSGQPNPFSVQNADFVASVVTSDDRGKTWSRFGAVDIPNLWNYPNGFSWAVEPGVAEKRGELVMILRTRTGYLYRSSSRDLGRSWSRAEPLMFSNPDSKHTVIALRSGNLVLLWNNTQTNQTRYPLMASLSRDGGRTWPATITVNDENVQMDYPAAIENDGRIRAVYGHKLEEIRVVDIPESDFDAPWTPINNAAGWRVADGVLKMADETPVENPRDWLRWSKLIAFRYRRAERYTIAADLRFDAVTAAGDAAIAVFAGYQDEGNWAAWVWHPASGHAGLELESHSGRPYVGNTRDISQTWMERHKAEPGRWYRVTLRRNGRKLAIGIDPFGRVHFGKDNVGGDHAVAVLGEQVADSHLAELRMDGASYVFAGPRGDDLPGAMERIGSIFGVKKLMLEGGGAINGSFLKHRLIDEFSTLIHPAVDGVAGTQSIVDYHGPEGDRPGAGQALRLIHCETLEGGMIWLRHAVERAPGQGRAGGVCVVGDARVLGDVAEDRPVQARVGEEDPQADDVVPAFPSVGGGHQPRPSGAHSRGGAPLPDSAFSRIGEDEQYLVAGAPTVGVA